METNQRLHQTNQKVQNLSQLLSHLLANVLDDLPSLLSSPSLHHVDIRKASMFVLSRLMLFLMAPLILLSLEHQLQNRLTTLLMIMLILPVLTQLSSLLQLRLLSCVKNYIMKCPLESLLRRLSTEQWLSIWMPLMI